MFGIDSRERQAHHLFMMMRPDQTCNHDLIGKAAAYHAATEFTDHVDAKGLPRTQVDAQTLIIDLARCFISSQIDIRRLDLDKERALQFALESLRQTIYNPNPSAWRMTHTTPRRAFDQWMAVNREYVDDLERWDDDGFHYGDFGPTKVVRPPTPPPPSPAAQHQTSGFGFFFQGRKPDEYAIYPAFKLGGYTPIRGQKAALDLFAGMHVKV